MQRRMVSGQAAGVGNLFTGQDERKDYCRNTLNFLKVSYCVT